MGTHQGFTLLGKAHAVVVGLEEAVAPILQRVANVHYNVTRLGGAGLPSVHLHIKGLDLLSQLPVLAAALTHQLSLPMVTAWLSLRPQARDEISLLKAEQHMIMGSVKRNTL